MDNPNDNAKVIKDTMVETMEEIKQNGIHALALSFDRELHGDNTMAYHYAKDVLTWLFDKPLASRLTDAEREGIRERYRNTWRNGYTSGLAFLRTLEEIFGKEMFNENK